MVQTQWGRIQANEADRVQEKCKYTGRSYMGASREKKRESMNTGVTQTITQGAGAGLNTQVNRCSTISYTPQGWDKHMVRINWSSQVWSWSHGKWEETSWYAKAIGTQGWSCIWSFLSESLTVKEILHPPSWAGGRGCAGTCGPPCWWRLFVTADTRAGEIRIVITGDSETTSAGAGDSGMENTGPGDLVGLGFYLCLPCLPTFFFLNHCCLFD